MEALPALGLRGARTDLTLTLNLGILLALICAGTTQLGFLYKFRGANEAPRVDVRHPLRSAKSLFCSKWFAIGMAIALGAWLFHVAALALAPMSVVQAVLSTGVVMLAVLAERIFGFEVGRRQWAGVAMTAGGLMLLILTLPAANGNAHSAYSLAGMISFEAGSLERARTVLERVRLFALAESLGGVESLISHPATMTHASVPLERRTALGVTDGLVRLSVGIEDVEDLKADLQHALHGL